MINSKKKIAMGIAIGVAVLTAGVLYVTIGIPGTGQSNILMSEGQTIASSDKPSVEDEGEGGYSNEASEAEATSGWDTEQKTDADEIGAKLVVYICGAVSKPAVYELPTGARICDAIIAAGGLVDAADPNQVNQAEPLQDGEMIYIPYRGEKASISYSDNGNSGAGIAGAGQSGSTKININTADVKTLTTLPGIGEAKAKSIVEYRSQIGAFGSIEEIKNVPGIGDSLYLRIKNDICI